MYLCTLVDTQFHQINFVALLLGASVLLLALSALGDYIAARQTAASHYVAVDLVKSLCFLQKPALWSAVAFGIAFLASSPSVASLGLMAGMVAFAPRFICDLNIGVKEYLFWVTATMGAFASWVPGLHSHHTAVPIPFGVAALLVFPLLASIRHCGYVIHTYIFD